MNLDMLSFQNLCESCMYGYYVSYLEARNRGRAAYLPRQALATESEWRSLGEIVPCIYTEQCIFAHIFVKKALDKGTISSQEQETGAYDRSD